MIARLALIVLLLAVPFAAAEESWVGKEVMPKKEPRKIEFSKEFDGPPIKTGLSSLLTCEVRAEKNGRLRVLNRENEVWVNKTDFVLVDDAPAYWTERLKTNPRETYALQMRASAYMLKKEVDSAVDDCSALILLDPDEPFHYVLRARAYRAKNDLDRAIGDYNQAIRLDPTDAYKFFLRGSVWLDKKNYEKAINEFDEAIRLDTKDASYLVIRALAWERKGDLDKAIADYSEAIRLNPNDVESIVGRGVARRKKGDLDGAIKDHTEAIRLDPKNPKHLTLRGYLWSLKKELAKAIEDCDKSIEVKPTADAFSYRAGFYVQQGNHALAIKDFEASLRLDENRIPVLNNLAWLLATSSEAKLRDGKRAVELALKANELSKKQWWLVLGTLAAAYAETGDFDKAVAEQKKALEDKSIDAENRAQMEKRLKLYQDKKPYRDEE